MENYNPGQGRPLPDNVVSDLGSKQISSYYRVVIEGNSNIYLSTHNINFDGNYYKPLLLKSPQIKHSLGLEDGKLKISVANLIISNFEYGGEIFSDILKNTPLINSKVTIFLNTQSSEESDESVLLHVGQIRKVEHDTSEVKIGMEDYTQQKLNVQLPKQSVLSPDSHTAYTDKYRGVPIPFAYGHIDKAPAVIDAGGIVKSDYDDSVELVTSGEDDYAHYDADGNVTLTLGNNHYYSDVISNVFYNETIHPLWVYSGGSYINIMLKAISDMPSTKASLGLAELGIVENFAGTQQFKINELDGTLTFKPNFMSKFNVLQGTLYGKPTKVSLTKRTSGGDTHLGDDITGFDNPDNFGEKINRVMTDGDYGNIDIEDANGFEPSHPWLYDLTSYSQFTGYNVVTQNLMRMRIETKPRYNGYGFNSQLAINGRRLPFLKATEDMYQNSPLYVYTRSDGQETYPVQLGNGSVLWAGNIAPLDPAGYTGGGQYTIDGFDSSEWEFHKIFGYPDFTHNTDYLGLGDTDSGYSDLILIKDIETGGGTAYDPMLDPILPYLQIWNFPDKGYFDIYFGINGTITDNFSPAGERLFEQTLGGVVSEVDMKSVVDIKDILNENLYLNIDGRKDDDGSRITDPISVLIDIASKEMNIPLDSIDYDSAELARTYVPYIDLAFSVNKFIDGRELFEEISRSIMCYPHFSSNGKLQFPVPSANFSTDGAFLINNSDIIRYSFSKTPVEKVYTRVDVKYRFDYETGEYASSVSDAFPNSDEGTIDLSLSNEALEYYGYENSEENVLIFKSKYIRELNSAKTLANRLFHYNRNQHLKIKLTLPLKWIGIEVGSRLYFENLIEDRLAYGIDYTQDEVITGQTISYLFFVTSANISGDSIQIEATQQHILSEWTPVDDDTGGDDTGDDDTEVVDILGCTNPDADNYDPNATLDDGSCEDEVNPDEWELPDDWGESLNAFCMWSEWGMDGQIPAQVTTSQSLTQEECVEAGGSWMEGSWEDYTETWYQDENDPIDVTHDWIFSSGNNINIEQFGVKNKLTTYPSVLYPNNILSGYEVINFGFESDVRPYGSMTHTYSFYFVEFNPDVFGTNSWYPYGLSPQGEIDFSLVHSHGEGQDALHGFLELFGLDKWTVDGGLTWHSTSPGNEHYFNSNGSPGQYLSGDASKLYGFWHLMHLSEHQANLSNWGDMWREEQLDSHLILMQIKFTNQENGSFCEFTLKNGGSNTDLTDFQWEFSGLEGTPSQVAEYENSGEVVIAPFHNQYNGTWHVQIISYGDVPLIWETPHKISTPIHTVTGPNPSGAMSSRNENNLGIKDAVKSSENSLLTTKILKDILTEEE